MIWTALILAGSRGPDDPVAKATGVPHKAMSPIAGRPMIDWVIEALDGCPAIGKIAVCGPADLSFAPELTALPAEASPAASVLAGLHALGAPLLVVTADNPLLRARSLQQFLDQAHASGADVVAGVANKDVAEQAGNPGRRTYLKFRDGAFSGCNLFAIQYTRGRAAAEFWRSLEADRKRPWRMAGKIGARTLAAYMAGRLTLDSAVDAIAARAGCSAAAVRLDDPLAAHDVDKPEDLSFVESILRTPR